MFVCNLINKSTHESLELDDNPISILDDKEYGFLIETSHTFSQSPVLIIGDVEFDLELNESKSDNVFVYRTLDKGFYNNAYFLNYFGDCEIVISCGSFSKTYIVKVNVNGYKANVAKEMLEFLADNSEDVLQVCFSKSKVGFSDQKGKIHSESKLIALTNALDVFESLHYKFRLSKSYKVENELEFNSRIPNIVDDVSANWLVENLDSLELSDSNDFSLRIRRKFYNVDMPRSIIIKKTNTRENRVLHQFSLAALSYLIKEREKLQCQIESSFEDYEYSSYVQFDQVIKGMINPILKRKIKKIEVLISRVSKIKQFLKSELPVLKVSGEMPVQSDFTIKNRHYGLVFESLRKFYEASDINRSNDDFLLGLRSLSQLFELSCLYYLVKYLAGFSKQISSVWSESSLSWLGKVTGEFNVLANEFHFENDDYEYFLTYEKKFYSLDSSNYEEQLNNLVRLDSNNFRVPDYTIKVQNKATREFYFIILDAKFSRSYKMNNNKNNDKVPSVLQEVYSKYSTNLKCYRSGGVENLTRYVGVLFGLSKADDSKARVKLFKSEHDIDGIAPMKTYAAADYLAFNKEGMSKVTKVLNKYFTK